MLTTKFRKVGGSVMMVVPPAILEMLRLRAGATVALAVEGERLIVEPQRKPRYTFVELLAECDAGAPMTPADREWIDLPTVGKEL